MTLFHSARTQTLKDERVDPQATTTVRSAKRFGLQAKTTSTEAKTTSREDKTTNLTAKTLSMEAG